MRIAAGLINYAPLLSRDKGCTRAVCLFFGGSEGEKNKDAGLRRRGFAGRR